MPIKKDKLSSSAAQLIRMELYNACEIKTCKDHRRHNIRGIRVYLLSNDSTSKTRPAVEHRKGFLTSTYRLFMMILVFLPIEVDLQLFMFSYSIAACILYLVLSSGIELYIEMNAMFESGKSIGPVYFS